MAAANCYGISLEVDVGHPVTRLLLRWIDIDESKHDKIVRALIALGENSKKPRQG